MEIRTVENTRQNDEGCSEKLSLKKFPAAVTKSASEKWLKKHPMLNVPNITFCAEEELFIRLPWPAMSCSGAAQGGDCGESGRLIHRGHVTWRCTVPTPRAGRLSDLAGPGSGLFTARHHHQQPETGRQRSVGEPAAL